MAKAAAVQVSPESLRDFLGACDDAQDVTRVEMRSTMGKVGNIVRAGASSRMAAKHAPSAAGYRSYVTAYSARISQSKGKTTGKHPEWGSWQMRNTLLPALYRNMGRIDQEFEQATTRIAIRFERA